MINNISFKNLKGRTGSVELAPLTVITGPNFAGKTTITTAITLACLGYHPRAGKTNGATFDTFASGSAMEVIATFPGTAICRTWKQSGKSVKLATTGEGPDILAVLNPDAFINANAGDRIAMLAKLAPADDESVAALNTVLLKSGFRFTGNAFEASETAVDELAEKVKMAKGERVTWEKTMTGIAALINSTTPTKPRSGAHTELELALISHRETIATLQALESDSEAAEDAADELAGLGDILEITGDPAAEAVEAQKEFDAAQTSLTLSSQMLTAAQRQIATLKTYMVSGHADKASLEKRIAEIEAEAFDATELVAVYDDIQKRGKLADRLSNQIEAEAARVKEYRFTLASLESLKKCPTCLACGEGWKTGVEKTLKAGIEEANQKRDALGVEHKKTFEELAAVKERHAVLQGQQSNTLILPALRQAKEALVKIEAEKELETKYDAEVFTARERVNAAATVFANKVKAARAASEARVKTDKAAELRTIIAKRPTAEAVQSAANAVASAENMEAKARQNVEAEAAHNKGHDEEMQRGKDMTEAKAALETADKLETALADTVKEIKAAMKAAMSSLFGPILKFAGPLAKAVIDKELSLNAAGEIGVQTDLKFIPFEALSGTEQLIATIAIQAGLSALAGGIVIVDEFSRVDESNKRKLANELAGLVSRGDLSQVIIVDHDTTFATEAEVSGGWKVVRPGGKELTPAGGQLHYESRRAYHNNMSGLPRKRSEGNPVVALRRIHGR